MRIVSRVDIKMRRKDKEIKDINLIQSIIRKASVCRIALSDDNKPYVVPVNFGYKNNCLFIHSAPEGKKIDIINRNNLVCFEIDTDHELKTDAEPCSWSMNYYSVIGFGKTYIIEEREKKREALDIILDHYSETSDYQYKDRMLKRIVIIKIEIDEMTGKKSGY